VVLDQVTGGYNIGAMFRLCDAFLVERLIVCGEEVSLRRRSTSQAAMGAQHWVPWQQEADAAAVVRAAKAAGSWVLAVEITAASVRLAALRPRFPLVLVLAASGPACRRAC
jgi:tRNA G18 (ribose-2'-O)-methylase SpoU